MIKTLRLSFSLKNTYRVNSILYAIRQIPLIGKIVIVAIFCVVPETKTYVNGAMMTFLPYMLFVMYMINRGTGFT